MFESVQRHRNTLRHLFTQFCLQLKFQVKFLCNSTKIKIADAYNSKTFKWRSTKPANRFHSASSGGNQQWPDPFLSSTHPVAEKLRKTQKGTRQSSDPSREERGKIDSVQPKLEAAYRERNRSVQMHLSVFYFSLLKDAEYSSRTQKSTSRKPESCYGFVTPHGNSSNERRLRS